MTYEELLVEVVTQYPKAKKVITDLQSKNKAAYQIVDILEDMGLLSQELKREYEKPPSFISFKDED
ncbi:MAG: hypothetical protein A3G93_04055 [Nitrospinae bacterium RIFCSPLOWO2_12_FULL_45_22]|nr:MAG: hypothetical protein A3G93_04055 [Nitrospinae bacterium RIFCSPLOWO2_12_FULL_45_22]